MPLFQFIHSTQWFYLISKFACDCTARVLSSSQTTTSNCICNLLWATWQCICSQLNYSNATGFHMLGGLPFSNYRPAFWTSSLLSTALHFLPISSNLSRFCVFFLPWKYTLLILSMDLRLLIYIWNFEIVFLIWDNGNAVPRCISLISQQWEAQRAGRI